MKETLDVVKSFSWSEETQDESKGFVCHPCCLTAIPPNIIKNRKLCKSSCFVLLSINAVEFFSIKEAYALIFLLYHFPDMDVDAQVIGGDIPKGIALMRLYCALKGMVGYKISNEESEAFLKLITCHPPGTAGGVRFVCAGLSSLLACTFIIRYFHFFQVVALHTFTFHRQH